MKKLICLLAVLLTLCSCDKLFDDIDWFSGFGEPARGTNLDHMPKKTHIGANTFGCYVDKNLVAVKGAYQVKGINTFYPVLHSLVHGLYHIYSQQENLMAINVNAVWYCTIYLNFYDLFVAGKNKCYLSYSRTLGDMRIEGWDTVKVDITYWDKEEQIICGEFDNLTCKLKVKSDFQTRDTVLTFTRGRFDVKYGINK